MNESRSGECREHVKTRIDRCHDAAGRQRADRRRHDGTAAAGQAAAVQAGSQDAATLYVVQGLPGAAIDVAVDGQTVAQNVQTTNVVGPFEVSAGTRTLTFTDGNGKVVAENTVDAGAGSSSDLVLHLTTAAGDPPVVTQFPNDLTGVPSDKASLTVAHTAAVPPADIRVDGKVLFANVANGESLNLVVPAGSYSVDIVPAGESSPVVFGPVNLTVQGGSLNRVYAVGDPAATTMNVAVHVLKVPESGSPAAHHGRHRHGRHRRGDPTDRAHPAPVARLSRPVPAAARTAAGRTGHPAVAGGGVFGEPRPQPASSAVSRGTAAELRRHVSQPSRPAPAGGPVTPTRPTPRPRPRRPRSVRAPSRRAHGSGSCPSTSSCRAATAPWSSRNRP